MKRYIKDGIVKNSNRIFVVKDGMQIINPTEEILLADGWVEYIPTPPTEEEIIVEEKKAEIQGLKLELEDSDYKVIKCAEAYLCGEELPYDIQELHKERNVHRAIINELEQ